jgi:hypothetical protein
MGVLASLVAHLQPPIALQPRQGVLHHLAITPQSYAGVNSLARNTRGDVTLLQHPMTARIVIFCPRATYGVASAAVRAVGESRGWHQSSSPASATRGRLPPYV